MKLAEMVVLRGQSAELIARQSAGKPGAVPVQAVLHRRCVVVRAVGELDVRLQLQGPDSVVGGFAVNDCAVRGSYLAVDGLYRHRRRRSPFHLGSTEVSRP